MVTPQYKRPEHAKSVDLTTILIITIDNHPVSFLEVKPWEHLQHISTRVSVRVPKLYEISAMRTRICVVLRL